jgi:hypothetical protein
MLVFFSFNSGLWEVGWRGVWEFGFFLFIFNIHVLNFHVISSFYFLL